MSPRVDYKDAVLTFLRQLSVATLTSARSLKTQLPEPYDFRIENQLFEKYRKMNAHLSIYEFEIAGLIPAYHTELVIGDYSIGFSDEGIEIHAGTNMDGLYGYRLITSIPLGVTRRTRREIREIIIRMEDEWPAESYDIFYHNCRHFSLALINELESESSTEARRILANLIFFSEKVGTMITALLTALVHVIPLNPLTLVTRPMEMFNQGRILDLESDFKIQLLQILISLNTSWIVFLLVFGWFSRPENEEDDIVGRLENMEL